MNLLFFYFIGAEGQRFQGGFQDLEESKQANI